MVPVRTGGNLTSLQFIDADGGKLFLTGGAIAGGYHAIGAPQDSVIICEGYATGASLHMLTGRAVAVAFNAGNLQAVAQAIRAKLPEVRIIVAADDDWRTEGNPGLTKARDAAAAVGGIVAAPPFDRSAEEVGTDWNDLALARGSEAARSAFASAIGATPSQDQPASSGLSPVDIVTFLSKEFPPRRMLLSPWLPVGA